MKKILAFLLAMLMAFPLFACFGGEEPDTQTSEVTTEEETTEGTTAAEEEKIPQKNGDLTLMLDKQSVFTVIRPDVAADDVVDAAISVNKAIKELTGSMLKISTDFLGPNDSLEDHVYEILVGNTSRQESKDLMGKLKSNQFAIKTTDSKIIIVGSTSHMLTLAVEYFIENYLADGKIEVSEGNLVLKTKIDYFSDPKINVFEELFESSKLLSSECTKLLTISTPTSSIKTPQGGYVDGEFAYQAFIQKDTDSNEANNKVRIRKVNLATKKVVATSGDLALNHANDITYNSKLDRLVVCHNNPNRKTVSLLDPETLEVKSVATLPCNIYAIDYNETYNMYVVGVSGGQNFRFLDENFQFVDSTIYQATETTTGYTTQGIACDDNYIYCVLYNKNVITVYNWEGEFVTTIELNMGNVEPENISVIDGVIYVISTGSGATVWTVTPKAKN